MAYNISRDDCQACGACKSACPMSSISFQDDTYAVDENTCVDCGTCLDACAFGAISAQ